jgi:type IV secretory pathway VirB2 component (pilin)
MKKIVMKITFVLTGTGILILGLVTASFASSAGMPWEGPMQRVANSVNGPVLKYSAIVLGTVGCIGFFNSEHGEALHTVMKWIIALALAAGLGSFFLPMLGVTGGVGF